MNDKIIETVLFYSMKKNSHIEKNIEQMFK